MRGERPSWWARSSVPGLTPAHAGRTKSSTRACGSGGAHPRACGENMPICEATRPPLGSPPRMRGERRRRQRQPRRLGLTPAHAGRTASERDPHRLPRAHPRACGENTTDQAVKLFDVGSPPRMRGELDDVPERVAGAGLTPAHAGRTGVGDEIGPVHGAHPRACGEHLMRSSPPWLSWGSPPRMRGAPRR